MVKKKICPICKNDNLKLFIGGQTGQYECKHCGYIGPLIVEKDKKQIKFNTGAVIKKPGSTIKNKTGGWRSYRPVVDKKKCIKCGKCWMFCPDSAIKIKKDGAKIDYEHCKGCGICAKECPVNAIKMVKEKK